MSEINFRCIGCGGELSAPDVLFGAEITCDNCETKQEVIPGNTEYSFICIGCDGTLNVLRENIGGKVRCSCNTKMIVPKPGEDAINLY